MLHAEPVDECDESLYFEQNVGRARQFAVVDGLFEHTLQSSRPFAITTLFFAPHVRVVFGVVPEREPHAPVRAVLFVERQRFENDLAQRFAAALLPMRGLHAVAHDVGAGLAKQGIISRPIPRTLDNT